MSSTCGITRSGVSQDSTIECEVSGGDEEKKIPQCQNDKNNSKPIAKFIEDQPAAGNVEKPKSQLVGESHVEGECNNLASEESPALDSEHSCAKVSVASNVESPIKSSSKIQRKVSPEKICNHSHNDGDDKQQSTKGKKSGDLIKPIGESSSRGNGNVPMDTTIASHNVADEVLDAKGDAGECHSEGDSSLPATEAMVGSQARKTRQAGSHPALPEEGNEDGIEYDGHVVEKSKCKSPTAEGRVNGTTQRQENFNPSLEHEDDNSCLTDAGVENVASNTRPNSSDCTDPKQASQLPRRSGDINGRTTPQQSKTLSGFHGDRRLDVTTSTQNYSPTRNGSDTYSRASLDDEVSNKAVSTSNGDTSDPKFTPQPTSKTRTMTRSDVSAPISVLKGTPVGEKAQHTDPVQSVPSQSEPSRGIESTIEPDEMCGEQPKILTVTKDTSMSERDPGSKESELLSTPAIESAPNAVNDASPCAEEHISLQKWMPSREGCEKRQPIENLTGENTTALAILRAPLAASSSHKNGKRSVTSELQTNLPLIDLDSEKGNEDGDLKKTTNSASVQVPDSSNRGDPLGHLVDGPLHNNHWDSVSSPFRQNLKTAPNAESGSCDKDKEIFHILQCERHAETATKSVCIPQDGNTKPSAMPACFFETPVQVPKNLVELAAQTPEPIRSDHIRILLNLFIHVDRQRLDELAKGCAATFPELSTTLGRRACAETAFCVSPPDAQQSILATMPAALLRFRELSNQKREQYAKSILEDAKKRKPYASRSLNELEGLVSSKFLESKFYKANASLLRKMPNAATPHAPPDEKIATYDTDKSFIPFTLEYNECSIAAISSWLGRHDGSEKRGNRIDKSVPASRAMPYDRPIVAPMFRKCHLCKLFGHYEIECNLLKDEDVLELAQRTKAQATVRELAEMKTYPEAASFRFFRATELEEEQEDGHVHTETLHDDLFNMRLTCEVCQSGLDDVHMLICDGCDKLFHLFCLDPPLKQVPDGDWFCKECRGYSEAVSSDVEIEACDGFVIEQRKRPRSDMYLREDEGIGFPADGWQTAIAVIGNDALVADKNIAENPRSKRRRHALAPEEEVEIDGFRIVAKAASNSPHVSRRMKAWSSSIEDISQDPLVVGSVVAWFPCSALHGDSVNGQDPVATDPSVGIVLAVESSSRRALVRQVVGWKDVLLDSWTERTSETPERLEDCSIRAVSSGATAWVAAENLHMVGRAAPERAIKSFRGDILPALLANERQNRTDSANIPEPPTVLMSTR